MKERRLIILYLTCLLLFFVIAEGYGQRVLVKESVTDATTGQVLPGVNVVEKGTQNGTITSFDGEYTIDLAYPASSLEFSFVGYILEAIEVGNQTEINVKLDEDIVALDELVEIGYGTQKKSDLTGLVSVVNTENMEKIASSVIIKKNEFNQN